MSNPIASFLLLIGVVSVGLVGFAGIVSALRGQGLSAGEKTILTFKTSLTLEIALLGLAGALTPFLVLVFRYTGPTIWRAASAVAAALGVAVVGLLLARLKTLAQTDHQLRQRTEVGNTFLFIAQAFPALNVLNAIGIFKAQAQGLYLASLCVPLVGASYMFWRLAVDGPAGEAAAATLSSEATTSDGSTGSQAE